MKHDPTTDTQNLLSEAIGHHRRGELTEAEAGYLRLLEKDPEHPDAHHLLGVLSYKLGNTTIGMERVQRSLSINPEQPIARTNLGNMLAETGRLEEAIEQYQRAIKIDPKYAQAYHNLGNVLGDCDRDVEAIASYNQANELRPEGVGSHMAMGVTLEKIGEFELAIESYKRVVALEPDSIVARNRLGAVFRKLQRLDEARVIYDEWLDISPGDPLASHFRAACEPETAPARATADYIKVAFDGFADEYDEQLNALSYQVPEHIGQMLGKQFEGSLDDRKIVADLGCGTGLCAQHLRSHAERLVGIDLSPAMLAKAAERNLYDEFIEADLSEHLLGSSEEYDLLVSADTLIYIGDLQPTFEAAFRALRTGGHLLFNIEKLAADSSGKGYQLSWSGRYVHQSTAVRQWLSEAGFKVKEIAEIKLRDEGNEPTFGFLIMAQKC